jgi:hypothetical protein
MGRTGGYAGGGVGGGQAAGRAGIPHRDAAPTGCAGGRGGGVAAGGAGGSGLTDAGGGGSLTPSMCPSGQSSRRICGAATSSAAISGSASRCCNWVAPAAASGTRRISQARPCGSRRRAGRRGAGRGRRRAMTRRCRPTAMRSASAATRVRMSRSRVQIRMTSGPASPPRPPRAATARHTPSIRAPRRAAGVVERAAGMTGSLTWQPWIWARGGMPAVSLRASRRRRNDRGMRRGSGKAVVPPVVV